MLERSHLESYICYCKYQKNLNNKTLKAYRIDLMQFFSWFFPYDACVSSTHIELYIEHLAKTYKTSTVKRKIAAIKSFYQYLIYKEYLEHSPFEKLQVHLRQERLLPRTIDNYTLSRIFSAAYSDLRESQSNNHYFVSMRDVAVLELLFATGVRVSELCSITCENLNLQNQVVLIKGKGSKERCIYISSPPVISALASYSALRTTIDSPDPYFFLNRDKHRLSEQCLSLHFNRTNRPAGFHNSEAFVFDPAQYDDTANFQWHPSVNSDSIVINESDITIYTINRTTFEKTKLFSCKFKAFNAYLQQSNNHGNLKCSPKEIFLINITQSKETFVNTVHCQSTDENHSFSLL